MKLPNIIVAGLGDVARRDAGFGPNVICVLHSLYEFAPNVSVVDVGASQLALEACVQQADVLIAVDSMAAPGRLGEIRTYAHAEFDTPAARAGGSTPAPQLVRALAEADRVGRLPHEIVLIAAVVARTDAGTGLSQVLLKSVPVAVAEVARTLDRFGVPLARRGETHSHSHSHGATAA